jgi:hypothetical protein
MSQFPLYPAPGSAEHGQSVFALALLEALDGTLHPDIDAWDAHLSNGDLIRRLREYLDRDTVVRAFALRRSGHQTWDYQLSTSGFVVADQTATRQVFLAARKTITHRDADVRELARAALRACREAGRDDRAYARVALLAALVRAHPDDIPRALRQWGGE